MTDTTQTLIRAFVAINPPQDVIARVETFQSALKSKVPTDWVRWTAPEQIHLTLRFLGNIPTSAVPQIESAIRSVCTGVRAFELSAGNFGWFPKGSRPRVLWLGVLGDLDAVNRLADAIIRSTADWGELEDRPFQAHLTIGRVKTKLPNEARKLTEVLAKFEAPKFAKWQVTHIDLMQSQLYPTGPVYTCIATVPLAG